MDRPISGFRGANPALLVLGSDHGKPVSGIAERLNQGLEEYAVDAIVIGEQKIHVANGAKNLRRAQEANERLSWSLMQPATRSSRAPRKIRLPARSSRALNLGVSTLFQGGRSSSQPDGDMKRKSRSA